jgi:lysozyme family protein
MTESSYAATKAFTISQEGGYSSVREDTGNWSSGEVGVGTLIGSNFGCGALATIAWMAETQPGFVVTSAWMKALPVTVYDGMAQAKYWTPLQCDALPAGLDLMCFDFGWNTGIGSSALRLQSLLGATQDGAIGPITLDLVNTVELAPIAKALTSADAITLQTLLSVDPDGDVGPLTLAAFAAQPTVRVPLLILRLGEIQAAYYRTLSTFSVDGDGWLNRNSARVTSALALASSS